MNDKMKPVEIEYVEAIEVDVDEVKAVSKPMTDQDRAGLDGIKKVIIPENVRQQMEEAGIDVNDVVRMILRGGKKAN